MGEHRAESRGPRGRTRTSRQYLNKWLANRAVEHGAALLRHKPVRVFLQIASGCNLDCYMCSEHNRPPETRHGRGLVALSREIFRRVEQEVFPYSTELTLGVGGEDRDLGVPRDRELPPVDVAGRERALALVTEGEDRRGAPGTRIGVGLRRLGHRAGTPQRRPEGFPRR